MVTTNERENQLLLNCFTKWCQWCNMVIREEKCVKLGIKQFQLALFNMNQNYLSTIRQCPLLNQENHLSIWEKISTLKWTNKFIEKNCNPPLVDMLTNTDSLSILPKNKLLLYQRYLLSKLSWHLTVANLAKTWVIKNLDSIATPMVGSSY